MTARIALVLLASLGCSSLTESTVAPPSSPSTTSTRDVAHRVDLFGLDLFSVLRPQPGNLVLSPTTIATALHAAHGVMGRAEREIIARQLAYISHDPEQDIAAVGNLAAALEAGRDGYDAAVKVEPGGRPRITSEVSYQAAWAHPFPPEGTRRATFASPGGPVDVQMMSMVNPLRYAHTDGVQLVELPFADNSFDFVVFLPDDPASFAKVEHAFATYAVHSWLRQLAPAGHVSLSLPRFTVNADLDLLPVFRGLTNEPLDRLFLEARHHAQLTIDEHGADAKATTVLVAGAVVRHAVSADRPFLWVIRERSTGAIVFLGRVVEPLLNA